MRAFLRSSSEETPTENAIRERRIGIARRNAKWTELEEVDLRPRGRSWLVSAETDEIYQRHRGVVFESGSATVIADQAELCFYVARDGNVVFLEKVTSPATWSEYVARQATRSR